MKATPIICSIGLILMAWGSALSVGLPTKGQLADQGTFVVLISGKKVGAETFEIRPTQGGFEDESKVKIRVDEAARPVEFDTESDLVLNSHLWPTAYSWKQTAPRSSGLTINFSPSRVQARYRTVNGATDLREFLLPKNIVVLDDNVFSQYEILVRRYLQTSGGKQSFSAFIPQEALPGKVSMEEASPQTVIIEGKKLNARRFLVTTELTHILLWTSQTGKLDKVSLPTIHLSAVRR